MVLSPLAMLSHLNNAKFSSLKRPEMEKEILKGCRADERNPRKVIALIIRLKAK